MQVHPSRDPKERAERAPRTQRNRRRALASALLGCLCVFGSAGQVRSDPPPAAQKPAPPPSAEEAAEAVLAARVAGDGAALAALARRDPPDPWLVADALLARGDAAAALAFAQAAEGKATAKLGAYVTATRAPPDDAPRRERLARANRALEARAPAEVLAALGDLPASPPRDVVDLRLWFGRALALRQLSRQESALPLLDQVADAAESLGWLQRAAAACHERGSVCMELGMVDQALAAWRRALALNEARGHEAGAAAMLGNVGNALTALGDWAAAQEAYERALAWKQRLGDRRGAALTLGTLGNLHASRGEFERALALNRQAFAEKEGAGDLAGAAGTLGNMASIAFQLGDYAEGVALSERAIASLDATGQRHFAAVARANLGRMLTHLGDPRQAQALLEAALTAFEALGARTDARRTRGSIGALHYALDDYPKARALLERTVGELEGQGPPASLATTVANLANVYYAEGAIERALTSFERALAMQESLDDRAGAALTRVHVGMAQRRLGRKAEARASLERAVRSARSLRASQPLLAGLRELALLHLADGATARALGTAQAALRELEDVLGGLGEEEGALARERHGDVYAIGALAAAEEGDAAQALQFLESGRAGALLDALGKRDTLRWKAATLSDELRRADAETQASARRALQAYDLAVRGDEFAARGRASRALDEARDDVRHVQTRIQREVKRAAGLFYPRAAPIEDVRASLRPGEALVIYGMGLNKTIAVVIEPDAERCVPVAKGADVEAACARLRADAGDVDAEPALEALRTLLLAPLGLSPEITTLLVSPDGPLCYLPWGALVDRPVALAPSGTTHVLLRGEERAHGEGVLALGDPDYQGVAPGARALYQRGRTLAALPATRAEATRVGNTVLLGEQASELGLVAALATRPRWRSVHFACHGLIDPERPTLSALALSSTGGEDGFLTALEVLRLSIPADLAVLSACETARGKLVRGEGIVGLTRAFMYAGAPRVLCSLWEVDDEATSALMQRFYELWNPPSGKEGLPAARALREAQAFVRAQPKWAHPSFWAAWVLWGLPD